MKESTKKQMVDFINGRCVLDGKRIPKSKLAKCTKEQLMQVINSGTQVAEAFEQYVNNDNEERKITTSKVNKMSRRGKDVSENQDSNKPREAISEEKTRELQMLVEDVVNEPTSFIAIMQLQQFIAELPYGTVSNKVLNDVIDELMNVSLGLAIKIFRYTVDQELYFQD